jgi:hypothetical protein
VPNSNPEIRSLLNLIHDYIACSKYVCELLKEKLKNPERILGAYRTEGIPKEGVIGEDVYYNFHGVGCYFELPNTTIDVDFGPDGRCDGFDAHRLRDFQESFPNKYLFLTKEVFEKCFTELILTGVIHNPKWSPSEHLYYLK